MIIPAWNFMEIIMFKPVHYIIQVIAFLIFLAVPGCFSSPSGDDNGIPQSLLTIM